MNQTKISEMTQQERRDNIAEISLFIGKAKWCPKFSNIHPRYEDQHLFKCQHEVCSAIRRQDMLRHAIEVVSKMSKSQLDKKQIAY